MKTAKLLLNKNGGLSCPIHRTKTFELSFKLED
jgi:hypothetical protein